MDNEEVFQLKLSKMKNTALKKEHELGLGGVPIGTAFEDISEEKAHAILEHAWKKGIRYYDTSPWYGLTKSERRFGAFLRNKNRDDFMFSTKVGRIFEEVDAKDVPPTMWKNPLNFDFQHDYSEDATKRSIENSLKRSGLDRIDFVFIHDLSEDQVGDRYEYHLEIAKKGAFKVLSDYRDQGIIKGWGMGVNKIEPILDCMDAADPNICLSATQYSILDHEEAVDRLLPAVRKRNVQLVSGAAYNSGFINGRNRFNYKPHIPKGMTEKREKIAEIAEKHPIDLLTAALQFVLAADEFVSIIPGMSSTDQVDSNVSAWKTTVPIEFWEELKDKKLIYKKAQIPGE